MLNSVYFQNYLESLLQSNQPHSYLLAVSGGADSMVLAYLMHSIGANFQVAHINYKLRAEASDEDQKVVEDFCNKHQVKLHLYTVTEKDEKPENSIQIWARDLRYRFFDAIMETEKLDYLVTAHHLNDQVETFFINLNRGSGIKGLCGIPKNENRRLRPLLEVSKQEIYDFAHSHAITFREDASNKKNDYLRNRFRNIILPLWMEMNPDFLSNFSKTIHHLSDANAFIDERIDDLMKQIVLKKDMQWVIEKTIWKQQSAFVHYQILKKFGFHQADEIAKMTTAQNGALFYSQDYMLMVDRNQMIISLLKEEKSIDDEEEVILIASREELSRLNYRIDMNKFLDDELLISPNEGSWEFDSDKVEFPIRLRKKMEGDVFYPVGMMGKKKISKFFKDEKISILAKSKIWILEDATHCVLGVFPLRQDRRKQAESMSSSTFTLVWG